MSGKAYTKIGKRGKEQNLTQGQKGKEQVKNSDGAYVYAVDDKKRLDRFLILGSEGGSYYASEKKLTKENAKNIIKLIKEDGIYVVNRVVEISQDGRAPNNDPALFVLAMASSLGDLDTRGLACDNLHKVARTGTHLFHFIAYRETFSGWARSLKRAVSNWYNKKPLDQLSYQILKYQSRDGWSHRDILRLAHVNPKRDEKRSCIYKWSTKREEVDQELLKTASPLLYAYEEITKTDNQKRVEELVKEYNMTLEMVPPDKRSKNIYQIMLKNYGLTALIRSLNVLTNKEILSVSEIDNVNDVCKRIVNSEALKKERIHPYSLLLALKNYSAGHGFRGSLSWTPVRKIVDALDEAFNLSFKTVEPTGKRLMLGIDVSGSMSWGSINNSNINAAEAAAAMAMVAVRTEENVYCGAFCNSFTQLNISPKMNLDEILKITRSLNFGSTDCGLPIREALKNKLKVDSFIIYTDSETNNYNQKDPMISLKEYRNKMGIDAKLVVVGMVSNGFTIADPNDSGCLDVVGFDSSTPQIISEFNAGRI